MARPRSSTLTMASLLAVMAAPSTAQALEPLSFDLPKVQANTSLSQPLQVQSPLDQSDLNQTNRNAAKQQQHQQTSIARSTSPNQTKSVPTTKETNKAASTVASLPEQWWEQGSDSPVAIAIGNAEGTRMPDGSKTSAYYWHTDPGNGADNFGTFSYQHLESQQKQNVTQEPSSEAKRAIAAEEKLPELADELQLQKLQTFHDELRQQAQAKGISLSEQELINGLDLANQSEAAALSAELGYIDRLAQMKNLVPHDLNEQILEARTWSYWSPEKQTWDAPGLGNDYDYIRQDQARRMDAIAKALQHGDHQKLLSSLSNQIAQQPATQSGSNQIPQSQPHDDLSLANQFEVGYNNAKEDLFEPEPPAVAQIPQPTRHIQPVPSQSPERVQQRARVPEQSSVQRDRQELFQQLQRLPEVEESSYRRQHHTKPGAIAQNVRPSSRQPTNQVIDAIIFYDLETQSL